MRGNVKLVELFVAPKEREGEGQLMQKSSTYHGCCHSCREQLCHELLQGSGAVDWAQLYQPVNEMSYRLISGRMASAATKEEGRKLYRLKEECGVHK